MMSNRLVFYHTLIETAGDLSDHQRDITKESELEATNPLCKSYAYARVNLTGTSNTMHSKSKANTSYGEASRV